MKPDRCTAGRSERRPAFSLCVEVFPTKFGQPPLREMQRGQREKQAALETEGSESDAKLGVDVEHCAESGGEDITISCPFVSNPSHCESLRVTVNNT